MSRIAGLTAVMVVLWLAAAARPVEADVGQPPVNALAPTVSGIPRDGELLTADAGTWISADPVTYGYQWQRCDAFGCADILAANDMTYRVGSSDIGFTIQVQVTATNASGSSQATSLPTAPVEGAPPTNATAPSISGTAQDGELLSADAGTWTGTDPVSYGYAWQRCDAGDCAAISGATSPTYRAVSADVGFTLRVQVTAGNSWGSSDAVSAATAPVQGTAPASSTAPSVLGTAREAEQLTADPGTWSGSTPLSYGYAWQRCTAVGAPCAAIGGATTSSYVTTSTDVGATIRVVVTATNVAGSQSATSGPTAVVASGSTATGDPVVAAAGDIACDPASKYFNAGLGKSGNCRQKYTADLVAGGSYAALLPLGDEQYECGGYGAFLRAYDLSWGPFRALSHPAAGDEEYLTSGGTDCDATGKAAGYFNYFGAAAGTIGKGWYSYDVGAWHVVVLNSNCTKVGGCSAGSPQEKWLKADLAAHPARCTLAYWHHPRFSSRGDSTTVAPLWKDLATVGADVLLTGHRHNYERFAPQSPTGAYDPVAGIREFVVGTGGKSHQAFLSTVRANSEVRDAKTYGILELTLHATGYDWLFRPETGATFTDTGSTACH